MRQAGVMLIFNEEGYVLGVSRRDDRTKFGLPGGKVEEGETIKEGAVRETREETTLEVTSCIEIYKREEPASRPGGEPFESYCFYAQTWEGIPKSSEEGDVKWLTASDLINKAGAYPEYNKNTLLKFREMFPDILIKGEIK